MGYYKIKNVTGNLPKRHANKDSVLKIEYHVGFQKKHHTLRVNNEILLTCRSLPVSVHQLRVKKLVTITEISENEFVRLQKPSAKKIVVPPTIKADPKPIEMEAKISELPDIGDEGEEESVEETTTTKKPTRGRKKKTDSTAIVKDEE